MITLNHDSKNHCYILENVQPKPWELRYTPISRDKARELDKADKEGKLPKGLFVLEIGDSRNYFLDGRHMLGELNQMQKELGVFFDDLHQKVMEAMRKNPDALNEKKSA